jgi:hypothetical protein
MARFGFAAAAASAALLVGASSAGAATVENPGAFNASFTSGQLKVLDGTAIVPLPSAVTVAGTIDENGNIGVPASGLTFPTFHAVPAPGSTIAVQLVSDGASGTLNPSTGVAALTVRAHVVATLTGLIDDTCRVGSADAPIELPLTTGRSGSLTGAPYNSSNGSLTLVDTFTLGTIHCDNPANDPTAALLGGLPNELTLSGALSPVVKPFVAQSNNPPANTNPPQQPTTPSQPQTPGQVGLPAPCIVPKLKGLTLVKAKKALTTAACRTGKVTKKKSSKKKGTVIASSPATGKTLATGAKVALTISDGPAKKKKAKKKH